MKAGESKRFNYTGKEEKITLNPGIYTFEVWGAQGENAHSDDYKYMHSGGYGGYSKGVINLKKNQDFYVVVGGVNGFNGGGKADVFRQIRGNGGGATDIRLKKDDLYSRILVAGGGGGAESNYGDGGAGGGLEGKAGGGHSYLDYGGPGNQNTGGRPATNSLNHLAKEGKFGFGGEASSSPGGGGGWFGGGPGAFSGGAGGGSGYVLTEKSYKPNGYNPPKELYFITGQTETGINSGNGYCIITCISGGSSNGASVFCKVDGVWKGVESIETKIDGEWKK